MVDWKAFQQTNEVLKLYNLEIDGLKPRFGQRVIDGGYIWLGSDLFVTVIASLSDSLMVSDI